jgi:hypothetical protein
MGSPPFLRGARGDLHLIHDGFIFLFEDEHETSSLSVSTMKRASLVAAVLLLQLSLPLVAQARPEEKAVGKAAIFYRHMNMARGIHTPALSQLPSTPKKPAGQGEVVPQPKTPEPVKTNPVQSTPAQ